MITDFLPNPGKGDDLNWINRPAEVSDEDALLKITADMNEF